MASRIAKIMALLKENENKPDPVDTVETTITSEPVILQSCENKHGISDETLKTAINNDFLFVDNDGAILDIENRLADMTPVEKNPVNSVNNIVNSIPDEQFVLSLDSDVVIEVMTSDLSLNNAFINVDSINDSDNNVLNSTEDNNPTQLIVGTNVNHLPSNEIEMQNQSPKTTEKDNKDPDYNPSSEPSESEPDENLPSDLQLFEGEEENTLNKSTISSQEESSDNQQNVQKKRKRNKRHRVDETIWKVNKNMKGREIGKGYYGKKLVDGKWNYVIPKEEKKVKERCSCKSNPASKIKCSTITEEDRNKIFDKFWKLSWDEKKLYINLFVVIRPTSRIRDRKNDTSRRSFSYLYFLEKDQDKVRVCKSLFLNTLAIGEKAVRNWKQNQINQSENDIDELDELRNEQPSTSDISNSDMGLKFKKISESRKRLFQEPRTELENFFDSLSKMESHYCRSSSKKLYLEPNWTSKQQLYNEYCRWSNEKNVKPLSIASFCITFSDKNLSLFRSKKDECELCVGYRTGNVTEENYKLHQKKKEEARLEKDTDKKEEDYVFTMDLQSVLLCPKSQVSSLYYKTKLAVHNLTFFNLKNKDVMCYVWHEAEGGLSANEFASCICDFVANQSTPNSTIIMYSDGCCYQNRNAVLGNALFNLAKLKNITILQKYLEKGHTQMEADSVHSQIERQVRGRNFYCPADYVTAIQNARKKPCPYSVKYLDHTFFHNYETLNYFKSIRPGKRAGDPCVTNLRALKYTSDKIMYKLNFSENWSDLNIRSLSQNKTPKSVDDIPLLLSGRVPIKKSKYDDLQSLKATMPTDYHPFYDNLPWK